MQERVQAHCFQFGACSIFFGHASLGPGLQLSCSAGVWWLVQLRYSVCVADFVETKTCFGFHWDSYLLQRCFTFLLASRYTYQMQLSAPAAERAAQAKAGLRSRLFLCLEGSEEEYFFSFNKLWRLWATVEGIMVLWSYTGISPVQRTPSSYSIWYNW